MQIDQDWEFVHVRPDRSPQWLIDWYSENCAHVIVMEIREANGVPHDEGRWIRTKATGVVRDIFKTSGNRRINVNDAIDVQALGGELRFGHVLARTGDAMPLTPMRRYLIFLDYADEWKALHAETIFLIEGEKLVNLSQINPYSKELHGIALSEVRQRVNAPAKR